MSDRMTTDRERRLEEAAELHALSAQRRADAAEARALAARLDTTAEQMEAAASAILKELVP